MKIIKIKTSDLKEITLFLINKKIIFHPIISPEGYPDFTGYENKNHILIIDRNLLVRILRLANNGSLKDEYSLKIVSSLLAWSEFNGITITAGIALIEYSFFNKGNIESNIENNIFLEIFNKYNTSDWLDLAMGRSNSIAQIKSKSKFENDFFIESDHFKMHYLEMLKISQLYFNHNITIEDKFKIFYKWNYENILICKYTTFYALLVFGEKSKTFRNVKNSFEKINKICTNQAWDLTYLSFWSTLYYNENESNDIFLFATEDKELKELFILTHKDSFDIYLKIFGLKVGNNIIEHIKRIHLPRKQPQINSINLDEMIKIEKQNLEQVLSNLTMA